VDADRVPPSVAPETSGGKVQDSVAVAPKLLHGIGPETDAGRTEQSAAVGVKPLPGLNVTPAVCRDQGSVPEDLRLSHAAMLLHLEGEHPAGGEPVSAHLAREG
jgi:hypothetical protein